VSISHAHSPTRKAIALHTAALVILLGACCAGVFFLQPFGRRHWAFVIIAIALAWLLVGLRRRPRPRVDAARRLGGVAGRAFFPERVVLAAALACWLGLILWSAFSAGGVMPSAPSNPDAIRVVSWNILLGRDVGLPWNQHGWPVRKPALEAALRVANPDILCVQEALNAQLTFLAAVLPRHDRVGVGRDDGRSGGEHCAIFFDRRKFEDAGHGTFWLEEPTDRPVERLVFGPKRICTWVRLRERRSGRFLRVYNTHNYLTEKAQLEAVRLILEQIGSGDPADAILLAGDFNAAPRAPSRHVLQAAGLVSSTARRAKASAALTYQFYGIRLHSYDDILVNRRLCVIDHCVLDVKPRNTFPSDHFGVTADLLIKEHAPGNDQK
jgi:endonuclease/exonuclease/phosphatase family metal-dependent hydrolase